MESNGILDMFYRRILNKTVTSWVLSKGTAFNVNSFLDGVEKILGTPFKSRSITMNAVLGGIWIRGTVDGWMSLSAFMHPTKRHGAGIYCGKYGQVHPYGNSFDKPGDWTVAFGNATFCGLSYPVYRIE